MSEQTKDKDLVEVIVMSYDNKTLANISEDIKLLLSGKVNYVLLRSSFENIILTSEENYDKTISYLTAELGD